jgi:hypothetical protein
MRHAIAFVLWVIWCAVLASHGIYVIVTNGG